VSKVTGKLSEKINGKSPDLPTTLDAETAFRQADTGVTISGTVAGGRRENAARRFAAHGYL
jgi:hypothetical protein